MEERDPVIEPRGIPVFPTKPVEIIELPSWIPRDESVLGKMKINVSVFDQANLWFSKTMENTKIALLILRILMKVLDLYVFIQSFTKSKDNAMEAKAWYLSKTTWGIFITIFALILGFFGYDINPAEQTDVVDKILASVDSVLGLIGVVTVIIGRKNATTKLVASKAKAKAINDALA